MTTDDPYVHTLEQRLATEVIESVRHAATARMMLAQYKELEDVILKLEATISEFENDSPAEDGPLATAAGSFLEGDEPLP